MQARIKKNVGDVRSALDQFLFEKSAQEQLGVYRFILCATLFYIACFRQMNIDFLGVESMIPRDAALNIFPDFYRPYIQWFFWPDAWVAYVHLLLITLLGLAALGLTSRPLMLLTWIIHQGVLNRNYSMLFGADTIGGLFLFYLSFTNCTSYFSLKNVLFKKNKNDCSSKSDVNHNISISSVFFRLMQIQLCIIYMYTGFEKLKGTTWWDGTALWTVFANPQFSQFDLKFLSRVPVFFAVGTFLSILFEVYFPVMMINKNYRKYWLIAGVMFHLGIGILLDLMTFSVVMTSTYILFLQADTVSSTVNYLVGRFKIAKI
ncbi:MAG: HTTM domain-containing protein [Bdellovibrio sp.]|nr:HTTM domain-containing protein [Bdellovibrio sp.]